MKTPVCMAKQYTTIKGEPVRILCTDRKNEDYPVIALVKHSSGLETLVIYTVTGTECFNKESTNNLIEVPAKTKEHTSMTKTICMTKQYKTTDGRPVQILSTTVVNDPYTVAALVSNAEGEQALVKYTSCGKYFATGNTPSIHDLVEITPYDDFKVDDKVLVSNTGHTWHKRYFSHVTDEGEPCTFYSGGTSWSQEDSHTIKWVLCKKAED
jgi:hypothetical protein